MTFEQIVRESYRICCSKVENRPEDYYDPNLPTDGMIAEDIADHYKEFEDLDLSSPEKLSNWCRVVRAELDRLNLKYVEEI